MIHPNKIEEYKNPCRNVRFGEDGDLENSTFVNNLIVDEFNISIENTGGDASWFNVNIEQHKRSVHNMVRSGLLYSKQLEKKWCYASETSAEV